MWKIRNLKLLIPYCCVEKREIICYLDCLTIFVTRLLIKGINKRCKSIFLGSFTFNPNLYTSVLAFSKLCKFGTFHSVCSFSQRKSEIGTKSWINMVFEIGQEVLRCQPFAYSIFTEYLSSVCDFCLKFKLDDPAMKLQKCSGCKVLFYCSTACQKKAWASHHKWECKCIGKMSKIGS